MASPSPKLSIPWISVTITWWFWQRRILQTQYNATTACGNTFLLPCIVQCGRVSAMWIGTGHEVSSGGMHNWINMLSRPNVVSCKIFSGAQQTNIIGVYLALSTLGHLPDLEEALNCFLGRYHIAMWYLNVDIIPFHNLQNKSSESKRGGSGSGHCQRRPWKRWVYGHWMGTFRGCRIPLWRAYVISFSMRYALWWIGLRPLECSCGGGKRILPGSRRSA